jgi:Protein of unknown function (DUF2786)
MELSDKERSKIIERLKGLRALSSSPNENEAALAAERFQEILAKYKLTLSDLGEVSATIRDNDFLTDRAAWIKPLLNEVAKLYFCGYFSEAFPADWIRKNGFDKTARKLTAGGHYRIYLRHNFIGKQIDTIVAKQVGEYLIAAMESWCKTEEKKQPRGERTSFRFSFMNAASTRLCVRLAERRLGTSSGTYTGTTLPALNTIYEKAQEEYEKWKQGQDMKFRTKKSLAKIHNQVGALAGYKAGDAIGLDTQLGGAQTSGLIGN